MSSVTFPTNLGGNGQTYTDDDNPSTGLRDGGWRSRFVPCLEQTVAIADALTNRVIFGSDVSSSSLAVSTGSKTLTTSGSYNWAAGMFVTIARTSAPTANYMFGQVVSYNTSTDQLVVSVSSVTGSGTYTDWTIAIAPPGLAPASFTGPTTIAVSSSSDALRITQTGSGNALVVEDSANPDSTPFVINNSGVVGIGLTNPGTYTTEGLVIKGSANYSPQVQLWNAANHTSATYFIFKKDRAGAIVQNGDDLGNIEFDGGDGTTQIGAARIFCQVDGTPGTNDMPGRLVFSTTADGASSPTEKMRINNAGNVLVGRAFVSGGERLGIGGNTSSISTTTSAIGILNDTAVSSAQTNLYTGYNTFLSTSAASFTLAGLRHFSAFQSTIGAGSTVTNQYGFFVDASLTGATNNYGFYSNIASGSGRYNFYAAGTANNYFAGAIGVGVTTLAGYNIYTNRVLTGATTASSFQTSGAVQSDVTSEARSYSSYLQTSGATFSLGAATHYYAQQGAFTSATVTNQYGFRVDANLTGATNDYGFYSAIASGSGRWNFYAAGTADNYFAGAVGIGGTPSAGRTLEIRKSLTGATYAYQTIGEFTILSDVTTEAVGFSTFIHTQNATFTLTNFRHFKAAQGTVGLASTVTSQMGFLAENTLTGAASNFGFYSAVPYGSGRFNFYAAGTADNYFAGAIGIGANPAADNYNLRLGGSFKSSQYPVLCFADASVPSTAASGGAYVFRSQPRTDAASFSISALQHFTAEQGTFGAGSSVTNQIGFVASSNLTGATNNYGFYSNIASGSGRYNFYAAGTADNYFAGAVGIGVVPSTFSFQVQASNNSTVAAFGNSGGTSTFVVLRNSVATANQIRFGAESSDLTFYTNTTEKLRVSSTGNIYGTSGTTSMTDGFFYIPSAAGAPSGVPTAVSGRVPMYYDTTNNNFYVYNGAWKKVLLT